MSELGQMRDRLRYSRARIDDDGRAPATELGPQQLHHRHPHSSSFFSSATW